MTTKAEHRQSRAVERLIQAGALSYCQHCDDRVKFTARIKRHLVVCNCYTDEVIDLTEQDLERFWAKVQVAEPDECWLWQGAPNGNGYGSISIKGAAVYAHRLAYVVEHGEEPEVVRHSCDTPLCVNPGHLLDGTQAENVQDMIERRRVRAGEFQKAKTHCKHGHEFTPENTYVYAARSGRPARGCRACKAEEARQRRLRVSASRWDRVETFHAECYVEAGEPYGPADASQLLPLTAAQRKAKPINTEDT